MGATADEHRSASESETASIARALAADLPDGAWILLTGSLGAGKTTFVRGLAEGLGIDPRLVHSPTLTLVSEYRGRRLLAHVDLYRVERIGETWRGRQMARSRRGALVAILTMRQANQSTALVMLLIGPAI